MNLSSPLLPLKLTVCADSTDLGKGLRSTGYFFIRIQICTHKLLISTKEKDKSCV